jgi:glycerol-3-phosphate dehydrogenase
MKSYDVIIIGAGIIGCSIARELSKYEVSTAVLESNADIATGTTKANGGIVHAGYDPKPRTLKSKLNVKGSLMYPKLSEELGFHYKNTGSIVVGFNDEDLKYLKKLLENAKENGVPGIRIIDGTEMRKIDSNISHEAKYGLFAPSAGIVEPFKVAVAFAENANENGVDFYRNQKVQSIQRKNTLFYINTQNEIYKCKYIINAAGIYADKIANMVDINEYTIKPRLGELIVMDKSIGFELNTALFPIPSERTKGIVVIPSIEGNILIGSTAKMVDNKEDVSTSTEGINALLNGAQKVVPKITPKKVIREFAGLRSVAFNNNDDFIIEASKNSQGFISIAGIQSPGVASAPAIAEYVRDILCDIGANLKRKENFNTYRKPAKEFNELSDEEKSQLIKENPQYGNIVCRCETITEGEIVEAIRRPVGATTIEGVKRRTRAGMGRCQGGFCQSKVLSILSRELGIPREQMLLEGDNSHIAFGNLK